MATHSSSLGWRSPWTEEPDSPRVAKSQARLSIWAHAVPRSTGRLIGFISAIQFSAQSCPTLCNPMDCSTLGFPILHYLPELAQTHVHLVSDTIQPFHPLSPLLLPPSIFPSIRVLSSESALRIRWLKYWSFSLSLSPFNEHPGLISFRMDWFDLPAVQGTLKSLFQHHNLGHCNYLNHVTQIVAGVNQAMVPSHPVTALDLMVLSKYSC